MKQVHGIAGDQRDALSLNITALHMARCRVHQKSYEQMMNYFKASFAFMFLWINAHAQIVNTANVRNYNFTMLSFNLQDSSVLSVRTENLLSLKSGNAIYEIKGNKGYFSPDGSFVFSIDAKGRTIFKYSVDGKIIKTKNLPYMIVDISVSDSHIYVVTGANKHEGNNSKVLKLTWDLDHLEQWETGIPDINAINITFCPKDSQLIIGAGMNAMILNKDGDTVKSIKTHHASFGLFHHSGYYSLLHKYSDGSELEFWNSDSSLPLVKKKFAHEVKLYEDFSTNIAVFECWDINLGGTLIATLDHSKVISIFDRNGVFIRDLMASESIEYIFFISSDILAYFTSDNDLKTIRIE